MIAQPRMYILKTHSGLRLRVRPLMRGDEPHLIDIFRHLSPDSIYMRFHEPMDQLNEELLAKMAADIVDVTINQGFGLLAFADLPERQDVAVGGARYVKISEDAAEVAVTVRDDMQKQGIGAGLLQMLARRARAAGIRRLVAVVQAQNRPVLRLLHESPYPVKRYLEGGEIFIEADISQAPLAPSADA